MNSHYVPHLIYSVAITSISIHLLTRRKEIETQQSRLSAQISILESLRQKLRTGDSISDSEVERSMKLAKAHVDSSRDEDTQIEWKEIFSRVKQDDRHGMNEWDKKDLEKLMKELGAGDEQTKGA